MTKGRIWVFLAGLVIGAAGGVAGLWLCTPHNSGPPANPQESSLLANLYVQTAAEYRACCLQTYALAADRLAEKLKKRTGDKRPAVVLDLDETVLDNSAFQSFLDRERLGYQDGYCDNWEENYPQEVRAVPGACAFIANAEKQSVTVVYVSNRLVKYRAATVEALKQLGIATVDLDQRLLLRPGSSTDKTPRFKQAREQYDVLLFVGDNLRDFSEEFAAGPLTDEEAQQKAIEQRKQKVDEASGRWGRDWFILPNPVYGEWLKPLGKNPRGKLRATSMQPR
jgi:5'-nucleotidase (lipoprotein e(P4) family)